MSRVETNSKVVTTPAAYFLIAEADRGSEPSLAAAPPLMTREGWHFAATHIGVPEARWRLRMQPCFRRADVLQEAERAFPVFYSPAKENGGALPLVSASQVSVKSSLEVFDVQFRNTLVPSSDHTLLVARDASNRARIGIAQVITSKMRGIKPFSCASCRLHRAPRQAASVYRIFSAPRSIAMVRASRVGQSRPVSGLDRLFDPCGLHSSPRVYLEPIKWPQSQCSNWIPHDIWLHRRESAATVGDPLDKRGLRASKPNAHKWRAHLPGQGFDRRPHLPSRSKTAIGDDALTRGHKNPCRFLRAGAA